MEIFGSFFIHTLSSQSINYANWFWSSVFIAVTKMRWVENNNKLMEIPENLKGENFQKISLRVSFLKNFWNENSNSFSHENLETFFNLISIEIFHRSLFIPFFSRSKWLNFLLNIFKLNILSWQRNIFQIFIFSMLTQKIHFLNFSPIKFCGKETFHGRIGMY